MPRKKEDQKAQKREPESRELPESQEQDGTGGHPCPVAGFGASAGGLEAFTDVLRHLPANTGLAVVFIQHLDPKHGSILTELLSRATKMKVVQAGDGMHVEPNCVYVIPPNSDISISKGVLHVRPRSPAVPHMPIDKFFRSLAEDQGGKAIGVVLSGTASDGTLGLNAIKAEGGITIAQSPESAKYDGMPRSAIAAGSVDLVLSPERIAEELVRLRRHEYLSRPHPAKAPEDGEKELGDVFTMLRMATGVDFTNYKPGTIRRRTLRRMALHKFNTPREYIRYLREHREELDLLFQDLLINVTAFFREPGTFKAIRAHVLPNLFKGRLPDDAVRVWVPGCSTGEEAYSVAITVLEYMREARIEVPLQVFGTDLSETALQKARTGIYPESIAADVSPERLRRFFVRVEGSYQIARLVRDVCVFAKQNVTKDPPFSRLDLITCRNLLIYLGPVLQGKVMRLLHYALKPNGYLVLGASEHIGTAGEPLFEVVDKEHRIYCRKPAAVTITQDFGAYDEYDNRETSRPRTETPSSAVESQHRVDRMILERYSPPGVVVDQKLKVLQFRGDTSPYLGHGSGEATLDITRMMRGGLGPEIRKLVERAEKSSAPVKSETMAVPGDRNEVRHVQIVVSPVHGASEPQYLAVFEPVPAPASERRKTRRIPASKGAQERRIEELETELASTRQYLQSVIEEQEAATEELKSAHEEVQSSNEELQSTNEELLTAKEELQSTNEELTTINEEMQIRNAELHQMNNDLLNLLSSVNIPIVMLGNDLRIRRFTPQAEKILNLIPSDAGRPINDFRLKVNVPDIVDLCREVIDTLVAREREVQDPEGRVYSMWVRPYRTSDNRIDGVVLALMDVTERKRAAEVRYRRLFETAKDGIVLADAETGEILDSNPFITKAFGYSRKLLAGQKFWESDLFRDTGIDEKLASELRERESVQKTVWLRGENGEATEVDVIASMYAESERDVVQFNVRDISERRRTEERLQRGEDQFRQAQKMEAVGRLAGGVAHDFNNILTGLLGYTDLLGEALPGNHPGRPLLEEIRRGAERAAALTRQLLAFGRKQILSPEVLDPNQVIAELQQMLTVMLSERIGLVIEPQPDAGRVRIDRAQLEQVVYNLVLNARDAIPDAGTITVSTADVQVDTAFSEQHPVVPLGRYVAITVKDTGTGMDAETQAHLFEPFFTTKTAGSGTGLGLATVESIVRQNQGHIWAYSELGVGSTFTVYLPRLEPEAAPAEGVPVPEEQWKGTETVLVVDDEGAIRALARRFLESRGYTVLEAANGPEALRVARGHNGPIHLMVTDVVMPRMSGREVAFQLAPERPAMKVMYMSGHTEDAIIHHGVLEKGLAFLPKPFTQEALVSRVRRLLDEKTPAEDQAPPEKPESAE
jgi:two-component system CheB/CheR fusion protein